MGPEFWRVGVQSQFLVASKPSLIRNQYWTPSVCEAERGINRDGSEWSFVVQKAHTLVQGMSPRIGRSGCTADLRGHCGASWERWVDVAGHGAVPVHPQTSVLAVQFIEAIVVLVRQTSHMRVTRALRCIFLVDCRYCGGVRR